MRSGLRISWQAVQLLAAAFLLPAGRLVRGRGGQRRMPVPLVCLPDCSGDGGSIGRGACWPTFAGRRSGGTWTAEQLVQPLGVSLTAEKIGFNQNAAEKANVGLDASDGVLVEGAAKTGNSFLAAIAPGDELAEKRVVIVGHGPARVDAIVQANAG